MRRPIVLLAVLIAMLWQSVALARSGFTVNAPGDLRHAALHWQGAAHHHHEDGSFHLDDSSESIQHLIADHLTAAPALPSASAHDFSAARSGSLATVHDDLAPQPFLDGLLRPPRLRS
ncbi:MAG: hypothetical protein HZC37_31750 [Burkholderiales bacterium]|nr:hypothetical protein [Burkholderiales bacterium]